MFDLLAIILIKTFVYGVGVRLLGIFTVYFTDLTNEFDGFIPLILAIASMIGMLGLLAFGVFDVLTDSWLVLIGGML